MKLVRCDGRRLEVRDVSAPLLVLQAEKVPIKCTGGVMSDAEARRLVKMLLRLNIYRRAK